MLKLAAILCLLCAPAWAVCGSDTVPAPAAAHGFTVQVFCDDFTSLATVDVNNTAAPGFKWYVQSGYGGFTPVTAFSQQAGGLQIIPTVNMLNGAGLYNMTSCAGVGSSGSYVGTALVGGMYIDITLTTWGPTLGGNLNHPSAWTLGLWQLVGLPPGASSDNPSPELDLREWSGTEGRYVHYWSLSSGLDLAPGGLVPYVNSTAAFVSGVTYGALILKPWQNGGTGTVIGYLNDVVEPTSVPLTWHVGDTLWVNFSEAPMCILFSSGYNQPIVIRKVAVWQAPVVPPAPGSGRLFR